LTQFGFSNCDLTTRFFDKPEEFEVLLGDLTGEGMAFGRGGFQRWLSASDRWKTDATFDKFKDSLVKQCEKSRALMNRIAPLEIAITPKLKIEGLRRWLGHGVASLMTLFRFSTCKRVLMVSRWA
jgi:hypothetical protein